MEGFAKSLKVMIQTFHLLDKHLLVAESTIPKAGNGVFAKDAIRKGEFVYEYCGEILTMEEAEVRAETYDRKQQTYLFDLDTGK